MAVINRAGSSAVSWAKTKEVSPAPTAIHVVDCNS